MPFPTRVLHVVAGLGLGGTEKTMQLFAAHMDRQRYRPAVHGFADGPRREQLTALGVDVHVGPDLLRTITQFRPRIVHIHRAGWPEPRLLRTLALSGVEHVVETNVFGRFDPSPGARIIDRHLFVSRFCKERYGAQFGVDVSGPRHRVVYNPVDTDRFAALCPPGLPRPATAVGRVSRPDPGKWSDLALAFLPHLVRREPGTVYRIIGATPEAREWIAANGLAAHVEFCDPVEDDAGLAAFWNSVAVMAHANDTGESFGMVIAEAMAAGLPVVTHPSRGLRDNAQLELVDDGVTGFVADTAEDYAAALARLVADPDLARRMGEAGRHKAARLYRAQTVAARLMDIYDELARPRAEAPHDRRTAPVHGLHG